ncbi:recombinase family protein [Anaerobacillus alkalidiazotrophicus]|uniref:Recombinase family protein n=1 Tax=Anaerobacillus alkalidiazotrophicus TaxID=472963 RepID=A0A1S2LVZ5_9BACI|nr:recombinase family protein [Anaerobacillus alkalidiazotrophicus]OIJ16506.1 recombinase family protein [Anaerobacillus alkalidiazotrophicus]
MRCAVYVRVSTDREEQKTSLDNQKSLFFNFIIQQGWDLYDFYVDVESGTTDKRASFKQLIEDAENKKFDCILAKELSRLARNGELSYKIRRVLNAHNIHLITLDGAINTLEDNTDKFGLYAWLYEEESQRISRRIKVALQQKARSGEFKGSNPPYGYRVENKKLYLRHDETCDAVKLIFQLYLNGVGIESIAKRLDEKGYPTPGQVAQKKNAGLYWQGSSVKLILKNPHYIGDLVQGRSTTKSVTDKGREIINQQNHIVVSHTHEPLIDREDFEAVQSMMKSRYVKRPKAKTHLFTNLIVCADCGTSLWYMQNRNGYVCGRYRKHGKHACTSHTIKEAALKAIIIEDLRKLTEVSINKGIFYEKIEKRIKRTEAEKGKKLAKMELQIEKLKNENRKFLKLLANEVISQEEYRDISVINQEKINQLGQEILQLKSNNDGVADKEQLQKFYSIAESILSFNDLNEEILHRLIERIEVKEGGELIIHYKFANPLNLVV